MEGIILSSILTLVLMIFSTQSVSGQISTVCSAAMLRSFSPCINFISNGGSNNSSPTSDCCRSLKYVMNNGTDCLCLVVTGNVPFRVPINRTLAISLPKACKMDGVPVQCKASPSPIPSPSPKAANNVPQPYTPPLRPVADTRPSPTDIFGDPDTNLGFKPNLIPSPAQGSQRFSVFVLLAACGVMALQFN
ncbi:non-specific lipid transfer protein GPI-anchored 21-like [Solanum lycopersicum]|uniref:Bifunctional inhibitor/plant lipid transfer protein/seed storage helical domain-containing protein n=1 Tax=Solanum lycopersicum TaxID=4081 RepID=K4C690_SOLLC|nr:non-specific lipid-transfer protein-like protein At2g13820 [Solanum lycopersicum]